MPTLPEDFTTTKSSVLAVQLPVKAKSVEAPSKAILVSAMVRVAVLRSKAVPASKVSVPEVYESEASERRNEAPSIESRVPVQSPAVEIERAEAEEPITEIGWESERGDVAVSEVVATLESAAVPLP